MCSVSNKDLYTQLAQLWSVEEDTNEDSGMSVVDKRNWDDYYHSFSEAFKYLDEDLTDPNRFPRGKIFFICIVSHVMYAVVCKVFYQFIFSNTIINATY